MSDNLYHATQTFTSKETGGLLHKNQQIELPEEEAKELLQTGLLAKGKAPKDAAETFMEGAEASANTKKGK